ncbi:hypothetical protein Bca4012_070434 [Brassica carinata]|uniref:Uncharacterized protein n=1 Tax=Brassica carinata TaxID=52824 RepID=A0A8X7U6J9_BRACI|nr:hypothetical protein Bca52824_062695 [Brassica carinata]
MGNTNNEHIYTINLQVTKLYLLLHALHALKTFLSNPEILFVLPLLFTAAVSTRLHGKEKASQKQAFRCVPTGSTPSRSIASNSSTKASTEPASAVANQTSFVAALPEIPAPLSSTASGGATEVDLSISVPDSSTAAAASLLKDVTVEHENPSMVSHQAVAANLLSPETCANKMESPKAVILATVSNPSSVPTVSVDNNRVPILVISAVTGGSPPSSSGQRFYLGYGFIDRRRGKP